jgi:hypothetical protein
VASELPDSGVGIGAVLHINFEFVQDPPQNAYDLRVGTKHKGLQIHKANPGDKAGKEP